MLVLILSVANGAGYRGDKEGKRDYWGEHYRNITKQVPNLEGVQLSYMFYTELDILKHSTIYWRFTLCIYNEISRYI